MTSEPATEPTTTRLAVTWAAFLLLVTAISFDCIAAPQMEHAVPERSIFLIPGAGMLDSGGKASSAAASPGRGHGLQLAALSIDASKLGDDARRAVNRWPAAQKANPAWDWARVLVFLVQSALFVQGHDPGKQDGLMGPKTMLALLAWSAASGPSWDGDGDSSKAYRWGLDGNVAHLLHGTLEAEGLSPGSKDRFLGRESVKALDRWDGTFRRAGLFMRVSEDISKGIVMDELGATGPSETGEAMARSTARESTGQSRASGYTQYECLKLSWGRTEEGYSPACYDDPTPNTIEEGMCLWWLEVHMTCAHGVSVQVLADLKDGRGPRWVQNGATGFTVWPDHNQRSDRGRLGYHVWEIPKGVTPSVHYCTHRIDEGATSGELRHRLIDEKAKSGHNAWYRNDYRDGRYDGDSWVDTGKANFEGDYAPNTTCKATY